MQVRPTDIPEVKILEPTVFRDDRGWLAETWSQERYTQAGISHPFVQSNHSHSVAGVVRGLHYQLDPGQAKLVWVVRGRILDVALDLRRGSATFGRWTSTELSAQNRLQMYIPTGFAHGFIALEDCDVLYLMSDGYRPALERGVCWRDPALGLPWPGDHARLSDKDRQLPFLADVLPADLPGVGL